MFEATTGYRRLSLGRGGINFVKALKSYQLTYLTVMRTFSFCLGVLLLQSCGPEPPAKPPNVLLIIADDLGYHDLSHTGSSFHESPNIDRLAAEGTSFTRAYAGSRVCSPSRATLMLGQFTATHGITDWIGAAVGESWRAKNRHDAQLPADYVHQLPAADTTIAEAFAAVGYRTFFAGKWHLGGEDSRPTDHGFEVNIGGNHSGSPRGGFFSPYNNPQLPDGPVGENLSLRLARETARFVTKDSEQPFFATLSFYAVHGPVQSTPARYERYRAKLDTAASLQTDGYEMERILPIRTVQDNPVYAGLVEQMDLGVGIVLDNLAASGMLENTIIVFTSDNGGVASGDAYATSNLPLRGGKGYQWEGGIRTPLIIYGPGIPAGEVRNAIAHHADVYPSLLDLADLPLRPGQHRDGVSLRSAIISDVSPDRSLFWHYPHYGNQGGEPGGIVRSGNYKLINYYETGHAALYNLAADPGEQQDISGEQPELVAELREELFTYLTKVGARFPTPDPSYDPAARAAYLKGLRDQFLPAIELERKRIISGDWDGVSRRVELVEGE